jgi:RNA polymerase sigma-70 factor (ECF subfamily)
MRKSFLPHETRHANSSGAPQRVSAQSVALFCKLPPFRASIAPGFGIKIFPEAMKKMPDTTLSVYVDSLYGYAMVLTRDATIAADLVLETYVRGLRAKKRVKAHRNVKSWLFSILRNIWLNQLRKQCTTPKIVELNMEENSAGSAAEISEDSRPPAVSKLQREQVRQAIQQLPVEFGEMIILREQEELSYQEIAALLECPPGTVLSRLARARSKLRTLLSAIHDGPKQELNEPFPGGHQ